LLEIESNRINDILLRVVLVVINRLLKHHKSMFQVPRNRKFYKERKDNTITREDDVKLFHFRNESVQWIADFLGNDDEETRGDTLSSVMKIKILLRYVADPSTYKKLNYS
jgi:hypothetical protein